MVSSEVVAAESEQEVITMLTNGDADGTSLLSHKRCSAV